MIALSLESFQGELNTNNHCFFLICSVSVYIGLLVTSSRILWSSRFPLYIFKTCDLLAVIYVNPHTKLCIIRASREIEIPKGLVCNYHGQDSRVLETACLASDVQLTGEWSRSELRTLQCVLYCIWLVLQWSQTNVRYDRILLIFWASCYNN